MASEKRIIDPTEYKQFLKKYIEELHEIDAPMIAGAVERCLYKLEEQPTVEAVEVVRCKDCKKWEYDENFSGWCTEWRRRTLGDHFCSYGERREGE